MVLGMQYGRLLFECKGEGGRKEDWMLIGQKNKRGKKKYGRKE
jgi:hypothetical protein